MSWYVKPTQLQTSNATTPSYTLLWYIIITNPLSLRYLQKHCYTAYQRQRVGVTSLIIVVRWRLGLPVNPGVQLQVNPFTWSTHDPPFLHGLSMHSLTSSSQVSPASRNEQNNTNCRRMSYYIKVYKGTCGATRVSLNFTFAKLRFTCAIVICGAVDTYRADVQPRRQRPSRHTWTFTGASIQPHVALVCRLNGLHVRNSCIASHLSIPAGWKAELAYSIIFLYPR